MDYLSSKSDPEWISKSHPGKDCTYEIKLLVTVLTYVMHASKITIRLVEFSEQLHNAKS